MTDTNLDNVICNNLTCAGTVGAVTITSNQAVFGQSLKAGTWQGGAHKICSFFHDHETDKTYTTSLMVAERNDAPDVAIRRANGEMNALTEVLPNEMIGAIYWQSWGTNGDFAATHTSPHYGRGVQLHGRAIDAQTSTSRSARLVAGSTKANSTVIEERVILTDENGRMTIFGKARDSLGISSEKWHATNFPNGFNAKAVLNIFGQDCPNNSIHDERLIDFNYHNNRDEGFGLGFQNGGALLTLFRKPNNSDAWPLMSFDKTRGNFLVGTASFGTNASRNIVLASGEGPSSGQAGKAHIYLDENDNNLKVRMPSGAIRTIATN